MQLRLLQSSRWPSPWLLGGAALGVVVAAGGAWVAVRRRRQRGRPEVATSAAQQMAAPIAVPMAVAKPVPAATPEAPSPQRLSGADLARALAQRTDLAIVDVRTASAYSASQVQAKGAIRANLEEVVQVCASLPPTQGSSCTATPRAKRPARAPPRC